MEMHASKASNASPENVWAVLVDLDGSVDFISGIHNVERLDDGIGFEIGTRWRETRTMFGKESSEVMEVSAIESGRAYTVVSAGKGVDYTSTMSVEAGANGGSIVSMTFAGEPTSTVSKILAGTVGRLFAGVTKKMIEQDLDDIAKAAEG